MLLLPPKVQSSLNYKTGMSQVASMSTQERLYAKNVLADKLYGLRQHSQKPQGLK